MYYLFDSNGLMKRHRSKNEIWFDIFHFGHPVLGTQEDAELPSVLP